jgi:NitT/TauT family transport system substrate-binding protein
MSARARLAALAGLIVALGALPARGADRISISQYGTVLTSLPWAVALDQGFLKKEGLDIDGFIGSNGGGTTIRNMVASRIPFAEVATPAAIAGVKEGLRLKIIYGAVNNVANTCWNVRADSPIKTLADLRGKKVGFDSPQGSTEMIIRMILRDAKLEDDVQLVLTGGSGAGVTALESGAIDAAPRPNLYPPAKLRVLFEATKYIPYLVWTVGVTTEDFARSHPETLRRIIRARRDAVDFIYAHPDAAIAEYVKVWQTDPTIARKIITHSIKMNYWSRGAFNQRGLEAMFDGMKLVGAMDPGFDANSLVDRSFLPSDQRSANEGRAR